MTDVIHRYLDCGDLHLGKINDVVIENMMSWCHSGFSVYYGKAIWPHNEENLARYIIRASFSEERMTYVAAAKSPLADHLLKAGFETDGSRLVLWPSSAG